MVDEEAHGEAARHDARLRKVLDGAPLVMFVVDTTGAIVWISGTVERLFGFTPDELLGQNMLDYLDLEWSQAALDSIGSAFGATGLQRPMLFRIRRKDGSFIVAEVTANSQLDDPDIQGLMVYVRRWDERYLLDRILESVAGDGSLQATTDLLVQVMAAETLEGDGAVLYGRTDEGFADRTVSPALPPDLIGPVLAPGSPWAEATRTLRPVCAPVPDLPEPLRGRAEAAGYRWCWAWPVLAPHHDRVTACLIVFRRPDEVIDDTCGVLLDNLVRLTALVVERDRAAADLRYSATHDPLTGLANRARFFDRLQDLLDAPADRAGDVGVLYIDLDGFKPINDRLGHGAGDQVLREIARRLTEIAGSAAGGESGDSSGILVSRMGGDEFTVLCPDIRDPAHLEDLARRLAAAAREPISVGSGPVQVGASIGIAVAAPGTCSIDVLVDAADAALYEAKASSKGGHRFAPSIGLDLRR